jgi:hypothetical protein
MNVRKTPRKYAVAAGGGAKRATVDARRGGAPPLQRAGYRIIVKRDWGLKTSKNPRFGALSNYGSSQADMRSRHTARETQNWASPKGQVGSTADPSTK